MDFDERNSEEWKSYILGRFHVMYAWRWVKEWLLEELLDDKVDEFQAITRERIMPYLLDNRPAKEIKDANKRMIRDMIRAEINRTGKQSCMIKNLEEFFEFFLESDE